MNNSYELRRETARQRMLEKDLSEDLYGDISILRLVCNPSDAEALEHLTFTARWFEHPHPNGRDLRGEADFAAIRLTMALHLLYDKVSDDCRAALDSFFLEQDYSSIYGSENHSLMFRAARLLAAQFYRGRMFKQFKASAEELLQKDTEYVDEFLMYRAGHGWGEFDSLGYTTEILLILNTLYAFAENERLKRKASMMLDVILLDMILDSKDGIYGGAHGRIYEKSALNSAFRGMYNYYGHYFGSHPDYPQGLSTHPIAVLSDYRPADIVYRIAHGRTFPYENRERKHLHCCSAWTKEIRRDVLSAVEDLSIDKYLYLCEDYMLGSVVHQDAYPKTLRDGWYAHHQQHEGELTLPGSGRAKIFSHHPGDPDEHKKHNKWTGDIGCCCGTHFCTRDTAISLYNIVKENELPFIHADVPLEFFDERLQEENYIFLRHGKIYIMVWFSEGCSFVTEGETANFEVISHGRKHAFICHVEYADRYPSIFAFADAMRALPISFDRENMAVDFLDIHVDYTKNCVGGVTNTYPFPRLYDSPYLRSDYASGIIRASIDGETAVYDFNFPVAEKAE